MKKWFKKVIKFITPKPSVKIEWHEHDNHSSEHPVFQPAQEKTNWQTLWLFGIIVILTGILIYVSIKCERAQAICNEPIVEVYEGD